MIVLVTGGSGSGKSAFAEDLSLTLSGSSPRIYLATMHVWEEEGRKRVLRHRRLRENKGFTTLELTEDIARAALNGGETVLLEDLPNLVLNEFYGGEEGCGDRVLSGIRDLARRAENLVIVTNEIGSDGFLYREETERYLEIFFSVSNKTSELSDQVYEVVYGIPVRVK